MESTLRSLTGIFLLAVVMLVPAMPLPARAAESYDNCTGFVDTLPATISSQGTWCLRHDLGTAITSGSAITVATNNVTIDCNGFKVGGLAAGTNTNANGIHANGHLNTTVRNCNVRGFYIGILTRSGGGDLIENNRLDGNTYLAIYVGSPGSTIRDNRVIDTGGSTLTPEIAFGISAVNGVDVLDNTVSGMTTTSQEGNASSYGIYANTNGDGSVVGNRVRGAGIVYGIYSAFSGRLIVRDNDLQGSGAANSIGVYCVGNQTAEATATARDNVIAGFATGIQNCLSANNTVNTN